MGCAVRLELHVRRFFCHNYELGFRLFGSKAQDRTWISVLEAVAAYLHVQGQ
jgi:hypothetical protein